MGNFRLFTEGDIFGFEELEDEKKEREDPKDDSPIRPFSSQWLMDSLARKKINGQIRANHAFLDQVVWGEKNINQVRVRLTPNLSIYVERRINDQEGEPTWIMKGYFKPNLRDYAGQEDLVAHDIFDLVEEVYYSPIDHTADYDVGPLARRMVGLFKGSAPDWLMYQDTKVVDRNHYIIYFALKGYGVGKLATRVRQPTTTPEATIDVYFDKKRGLIRIILTTVTVGGEGDDWQIDIPYLDSFYAPTQKKDEIIQTVLTALKFH